MSNKDKQKTKKITTKKVDTKKVTAKKVEPKKVEPKKVEPKKVEPKKVEPKKVEPKKVEPKKVDAKKVDAKKVDAKKVDAKKVDAKKVDAKKVDAKKSKSKASKNVKTNDVKKITPKKPTTKKVNSSKAKNPKIEDSSKEEVVFDNANNPEVTKESTRLIPRTGMNTTPKKDVPKENIMDIKIKKKDIITNRNYNLTKRGISEEIDKRAQSLFDIKSNLSNKKEKIEHRNAKKIKFIEEKYLQQIENIRSESDKSTSLINDQISTILEKEKFVENLKLQIKNNEISLDQVAEILDGMDWPRDNEDIYYYSNVNTEVKIIDKPLLSPEDMAGILSFCKMLKVSSLVIKKKDKLKAIVDNFEQPITLMMYEKFYANKKFTHAMKTYREYEEQGKILNLLEMMKFVAISLDKSEWTMEDVDRKYRKLSMGIISGTYAVNIGRYGVKITKRRGRYVPHVMPVKYDIFTNLFSKDFYLSLVEMMYYKLSIGAAIEIVPGVAVHLVNKHLMIMYDGNVLSVKK